MLSRVFLVSTAAVPFLTSCIEMRSRPDPRCQWIGATDECDIFTYGTVDKHLLLAGETNALPVLTGPRGADEPIATV